MRGFARGLIVPGGGTGTGGGGGLTNIKVSAGTLSALRSDLTFNNSNGVSFGLETNGIITATVKTDYQSSNANYLTSQSNQAASGQNGSFAFQTLSFSNANGLSFGTSAGNAITASHNAITTARASTDAIGLNTAKSNVTWTVNSSGLSLDARGYAGTGTSATNASITLDSNGLAISVAAPGGGGAVNFSAGTTSNNLQTVVFSDSNGVSFGLNGSTITASVAGGGGNATYSTWHNHPINIITSVGAPINNQYSVVYCPLYEHVTGTRLDIFGSVNVGTQTNNSSAALLYTLTAVLLTRNGDTLNSLSSGTTGSTYTWSSNNTSGVTGGRAFSAPVNINGTPGNYFLAVQLSTRATGQTGAATTSLGNTITLWGVGTGEGGAITVADFAVATNSSSNWYPAMGLNSSSGNITQISVSNLTMAGSGFQRANLAVRVLA